MSKIYMINNGYHGCCYVRILLPAFNNGFLTDKSSVGSELCQDHALIERNLRQAEVVVFHRPESQEHLDLIKILKKDGKKIVVDNDDTFKMDDDHPLAVWTWDAKRVIITERDRCLDESLRLADLVTTTTETLKEEYSKINDKVEVLPNCVDPMDWDEPIRNEGKKVRIGLVGSTTFSYDYGHVKDVLRELSDRDDVQLVMFGWQNKVGRTDNPKVTEYFEKEYKFWDSLDIEQIPNCPSADYPSKLNEAKLDIMLIPRRENYFNICKSNVKFLEASMCEIPVIAQSFDKGAYEEITADMGFLIKDNSKWMEAINIMIDNKELRREMGKKAKEYVLNNYNIEEKASLWDEAYQKLIN